MSSSARMAAAFLGHGSPMNALDDNRYTRAWRAFGEQTGRPAAILVVSAHWYTNTTAVTAMARPRTIHDFSGFPDPLFAVEYPAPGDPALARRVTELLAPTRVGLDTANWGIDHGSWSVLRHVAPDADVPVVQLSVNATEPPEHHFDLGRRLGPLRDEGVVVIASGNVVHNLPRLDWSRPDRGEAWARRFDERVVELMTSAPGDILSALDAPDYHLAVPTPDHFLPLLYIAGLAHAASQRAGTLAQGYAMGALSMTCFSLAGGVPGAGGPAAPLPDIAAEERDT